MNYAQIQALVIETIKDDDLVDDPTIVQGFISDFESTLSGDLLDESYGQEIPRQMLKRTTDTTDVNGQITLPADYLRMVSVIANNAACKYIEPEKVQTGTDSSEGASIEYDYYSMVPKLAAADTNWVSDNYHTVYKWGASLQYIGWAHRYDNLQAWTGFYVSSVKSLKKSTGVRPRGGLFRQKARPYNSFYTIIGDKLYFTNSMRRTANEPLS